MKYLPYESLAIMMVIILVGLPLSTTAGADKYDSISRHVSTDFQIDYSSDMKHSSISSNLLDLVEYRYAKGGAQVETMPWIRADETGQPRVKVIVEADPVNHAGLVSAVSGLGAKIETSNGNFIQVSTPINLLVPISSLPDVDFVRLPSLSRPDVLSEGLDLFEVPTWHDASFSGSGIKVAILDGGFQGYQSLLGTELPSTVTIFHPQGGSDIDGWGAHGVACAEIIHDIAPDAEIYLAYFQTEAEWLDAVDWLIQQKVDIVSHSVSWIFAGPGDGTGWACDKVMEARDAGITWSQSAGNYAKNHWQGRFSDPDIDSIHNFTPHDETNKIWIQAGKKAQVALRWDDPWDASANDYDLYLLNYSGSIVASSTNLQDGDDHPQERIESFVYATGWYSIQIRLASGDGSAFLDLITPEFEPEHQVSWGSIPNPGDAPAALTTGAFAWDDISFIRSYSGRGPTLDSRTKPDLVAPDGVDTQTYSDPFYGTSASTAHVAGAAALVLEHYPGFSPYQVKSFLKARASAQIPDADNLRGEGRLSLGALPITIRVQQEIADDPPNHIFDSIAEGVADAGPGDKVRVESGTYVEKIIVDKQLVLEGIGMPVIDAKLSSSAISLRADGSMVTGFDLRRSGFEEQDGALSILSDGNTIDNIVARDSWNGVCVWSCAGNLLGGITAQNNYYGITIIDGESNQCFYNNLLGNGVGAWDNSAGNMWDNGIAGNFWDGYSDRYPAAAPVGLSNVWDTPYQVNGGPAHDMYPLVEKPLTVEITHPQSGAELTFAQMFSAFVQVTNNGPLTMKNIDVSLAPGQYARICTGEKVIQHIDSLDPGASGTVTWQLRAGTVSGNSVLSTVVEADVIESVTLKAQDASEITVAGWDPWVYDVDKDSILEFDEFITAFMDYLGEVIDYDQMVAVLMLYLV